MQKSVQPYSDFRISGRAPLMITSGIFLICGWALSIRIASRPPIPGIMMSIRIRSGVNLLTKVSPSSAEAAL